MQKNNYMDIMEKNHMEIPWHDYTENDSNVLINKAGLIEKASVIGRVGLIMLSCGTGAWRVRTSMNRLAKELGVTCTVDVGLMSIEFNCFDGKECVSQSLSIANTGVNTSKLYRMEQFVDNFPKQEAHLTGEEIHRRLDEIESIHTLYSPAKLGLAAALACCAFTFLLGGGPIEMVLAFIAAGIGNVIRTKLIKHHYTLFLNIAVSISAACLTYTVCLHLAEMLFHIPSFHEAGYICSMLFIIPGFPFITSGIDLAKLDLRSGLERLTYSVIIVLVATMFAWIMALLLKLQPQDFSSLSIDPVLHLLLRLITSFCGVFGFSIMFNSSIPMAATAAFIGATVGFLWYNSYPAQVFMGDTGSLTLGGIIAVFAIIIRKELLIPILCGIFLVENISVMLQVAYFKYTKKKYGEGRRIFKMAPLHHHFQKPGNAGIQALIQKPFNVVPESKIVVRFWLIGIILAVMTIVTLKMR
jgi:UDP-N-acetylmuramyl pentapeptide phosphotransferase/UDP-N-acetylglucosamine-1-phosphate transferase